MRENLRIEGPRFKGAFRFVFRANRKDFAGIRGAQEDFSVARPGNAGDLRRTRFGKLRISAALIDRQQRTIIAGAGEQPSVRGHAQRIDDVVPRTPKLFWRAVGSDAVNAAGNHGGKWRENGLPRDP